MRRKRKSQTPEAPLAPVTSEILDQFVRHAPISPQELNAAVRRFKKAILEALLRVDAPSRYLPGGEKPDETTDHRNGTGSNSTDR
jgi:hypothetical protein